MLYDFEFGFGLGFSIGALLVFFITLYMDSKMNPVWIPIEESLPTEGVLVKTVIIDHNGPHDFRLLRYQRTLWWDPNYATMAVDTPTHWRPIEGPDPEPVTKPEETI